MQTARKNLLTRITPLSSNEMMFKHVSIYAFLLFFTSVSFLAHAQTILSGTVKNSAGWPVASASVTITNAQEDNILNYAITNLDGKFSIPITSSALEVQINIRSMGFKTMSTKIINKTQELSYVLEEEVTVLKDVVVRGNPIYKKGDTINYNVASFANPEDRTIGDVLKNMPGIEVLSDGKILYQGKPINKYYIEGLDLLEGKYNLANNNLPFGEVAKVQVLENHQPIRMLDSLVFSEQAALNIKLKNRYTVTGQVEAGAGFKPLLREVNATPMLFTKTQQMISSYQSNNTGNNVANQLKTLTTAQLIEQFERKDFKQDWLAIQQLATPLFSDQRWLDNNINIGTANHLLKLKKDFELRTNISYINDYQQQRGFTNTQFFTPSGTIALSETKYNQLYTNSLETNLTLQRNTSKNFIKNSLLFKGYWDSQRGAVQLNMENIEQQLSNQFFSLSNDLDLLFPLGKQVATLNSYISYQVTPQTLRVNPGQFNDLVNNGNAFNELTQNLNIKTLFTNNGVGFTKGVGAFSFTPRVGLQLEYQQLETDLLTNGTASNGSLENNLDWLRSQLYARMTSQYKKDKWRIELTTPLNLHTFAIEDLALQQKQDLTRITFEPRLRINYELTPFWNISTGYSRSNDFGSINRQHFNVILRNYRNIQRIDAPLLESQTTSYTASLGYRNPLKSVFFNITYANGTTRNNLLYNNQILTDGTTELQAITQDNNRLSHNVLSRFSKYFSGIKTNATLNLTYSAQDLQQIINNTVTDIANQSVVFTPKIDTDLWSWFNMELESSIQFANNSIQGQDNQTITQQFHRLNLNMYPKKNHFISLRTEYIRNNLFSVNTTNFFADFVYRYTWKKRNIDLEFNYNNIFNTSSYQTINVSNFSYVETNFALRPSQVLFKIRFSI